MVDTPRNRKPMPNVRREWETNWANEGFPPECVPVDLFSHDAERRLLEQLIFDRQQIDSKWHLLIGLLKPSDFDLQEHAKAFALLQFGSGIELDDEDLEMASDAEAQHAFNECKNATPVCEAPLPLARIIMEFSIRRQLERMGEAISRLVNQGEDIEQIADATVEVIHHILQRSRSAQVVFDNLEPKPSM
jgi:replicative DNA helicase